MIPVDQTTFGFPGGNCLSACIASLLELPIEEVPYFGADGNWLDRLALWLTPRGFWPLICPLDRDARWYPPVLHILSGKGPRDLGRPDVLHSVVAYGNEIVHDPHPSRAGLITHEDVVLLVPVDPAQHLEDPT